MAKATKKATNSNEKSIEKTSYLEWPKVVEAIQKDSSEFMKALGINSNAKSKLTHGPCVKMPILEDEELINGQPRFWIIRDANLDSSMTCMLSRFSESFERVQKDFVVASERLNMHYQMYQTIVDAFGGKLSASAENKLLNQVEAFLKK